MLSAISYLIGSNILEDREVLSASDPDSKQKLEKNNSTPEKNLLSLSSSSSSSTIDSFNAFLSGALEAEVEGDYSTAAGLLDQADKFISALEDPIELFNSEVPVRTVLSPGGVSTCHLCGRRVASIVQHMKTCPKAQSTTISSNLNNKNQSKIQSSSDARHAMIEMVKVSQKRLESTIISSMRTLSKDGSLDECRQLWLAGSASLRSEDCDILFADIVRAHFVEFARPVSSTLDATRTADANKLKTKLDNNVIHPYIKAHARLLCESSGITSLATTDSFMKNESSDSLQIESKDTDPIYGVTSRIDGVHLQAHLEALSTLLGEASTWMAMIHEQPVPHSSRCLVAGSLHKACVDASLPVVRAYRDDGLLTATGCVAKALIDCAEGNQSSLLHGSKALWESTLRAASNPPSQRYDSLLSKSEHNSSSSKSEHNSSSSTELASFSSLESGNDLKTMPKLTMIHIEFEEYSSSHPGKRVYSNSSANTSSSSTSNAKRGPPTSKHQFSNDNDNVTFINPDLVSESTTEMAKRELLLPLNLTLDGATAVVDEACEKATFMCQILERYLRCVTVCLGLGTSEQPSRTSDPLADSMHELQGDYVLLERAFLTTAVARATVTSPEIKNDSNSDGWVPVVMGDDSNELCFAWVDHSLFVLSKAIARACATCCDLAAAAVINFVAGCIDVDLRRVASMCVEQCSELRNTPIEMSLSNAESTGVRNGSSSDERDDIDNEVAKRIAAALEVEDENARNVDVNVQPLQGGMLLDDKDAGLIAAVNAARKPRVSDDALIALNTVATAATYLRSLFLKTRAEVELVFPPPISLKYSEDSSETTSTESFSRPPVCHQLVAGTLDNLRSVAESFTIIADDAAKRVAESLISVGLNSMSTLLRLSHSGSASDGSYSYMISQQTFDTMTLHSGRFEDSKGGGIPSSNDPLLSSFEHDLVIKSGLVAALQMLRKQDSIECAYGPSCTSDLVLKHVSLLIARLVEDSWTSSVVSEYGALLQAAQLREFIRRLSSLARNPHVAVAKPFSRLTQVASVLSLDSLPDLYSLSFFPKALLSRSEVSKLLLLRVGLVRSNTAIDALAWDKVQCIAR
jgi:hypothetical protein